MIVVILVAVLVVILIVIFVVILIVIFVVIGDISTIAVVWFDGHEIVETMCVLIPVLLFL